MVEAENSLAAAKRADSDLVAREETEAGCEDRGSTTLMTPTARYGAFISYSHAASAEVARGLQKWLQTYAKPWWRWRAVISSDQPPPATGPQPVGVVDM